ncbi:MAG: DoxX family membrane protein [Chitinophagaceae bacterium]|nr:DoxX family membrane protein [Chitinophagaceae bacterium]
MNGSGFIHSRNSFAIHLIVKNISLYLMVFLYVIAGINHFLHPQSYMKIMPPSLPWPEALIYISGSFEIISGLLLIPISTRRFAAWCIIILLIIIFPANLQMMLNYRHDGNPWFWITILRLPLQLLLIWWAYTFTKRTKAST